jgi:4-amino-4-deoxy-L-arabinose transferase-like glycosyltransferase
MTGGPLQRYAFAVVFTGVLLIGLVIYFRQLTTNPPGFFIDESSVAYNAFTISETGRDEYGAAWPLYFRAFGDYKNPVYVYLLALIFRFTGPSILVARVLSASSGIMTTLLLGLIGYRLTKQRWLALALMAMAFATPWLFVLSRSAVEVALYPLAVALFLLAVARVAEKHRWKWIDALWIGLTLALLTYTYSIGRLLAPLLAIGLVIFARRVGILSVARAWLIYAATLAPLLIFRWRHPGALEARFTLLTYLTPQLGFGSSVSAFVGHYFHNINPWRMIVSGDPAAYQIASTYGTAPVLLITFLLVVASIFVWWKQKRLNAWWVFVIYGFLVSIVPASLTREYFHVLRLSPVPVFMILLTIPALQWLTRESSFAKRPSIAFVFILICAQAIYSQVVNEQRGREPFRQRMFDADYRSKILPAALGAAGSNPIYIKDEPAIPGYIQARWYATLEHLPLDKFLIVPPGSAAPEGAIVISTEASCGVCEVLYERSPYRVYRVNSLAR